MSGAGREGDWECSGCGNQNYAFRCFCNRCKQPRLFVDAKTPHDSKWLPRIGDWICTGCTNNNYASREICKKCGQPKEVAAMPATAIPGASLQTYPNYFARAPSGFDQRTGLYGSGAPQQSLSLSSNWSLGGTNKYSFQPASTWPAGGNHNTSFAHASPANPLMTTNGWRSGDWICSCGFHNYSSRTQCKKCNAAVPPAQATGLGTKRLASDELAHGLDSKRLNAGQTHATMPQTYPGTDSMGLSNYNQANVKYSSYMSGTSSLTPNFQVHLQTSTMPAPAIFGKGAKQWRDGDWMCVKCSNHNYASRSQCNRCKTEREVLPGPGPGPGPVTVT